MTELVVPKCIAPDCGQPAMPEDALCSYHREKLQRIEEDILKEATRWVKLEMRQFERLILEEPPLHSAEIAHRMPWPMKKVRQMLRRFKDDRA